MAVKIEAADLTSTINGLLEEFGQEAADAVEASSKKTAKEVVKDLRKGGRYQGGEDFNKGWTSSTTRTRLGTETVVYNRTKPGLAHLLEFGHVKSTGGRTEAFNFISPVADTVGEIFSEAFEEAMNR